MKYELLEAFGIIWTIGTVYMVVCLFSQILFGKTSLKTVIRDTFLIWFWPLLLVSPNGRKKIVNLLKII